MGITQSTYITAKLTSIAYSVNKQDRFTEKMFSGGQEINVDSILEDIEFNVYNTRPNFINKTNL